MGYGDTNPNRSLQQRETTNLIYKINESLQI